MKNQLANLQNNESILLMYLAGELPAEDRAEVESLLQSDQSLRAQLDELQATHDQITAQIRAADQATPLVGQFSAARQVGAAIRQKHADALRALENQAPDLPHRQLSWWIAGPLVGAACIALGMFLWWRYGTNDVDAPVQLVEGRLVEEDSLLAAWSGQLEINSLGQRQRWLSAGDDSAASDSAIGRDALDSLWSDGLDSDIN